MHRTEPRTDIEDAERWRELMAYLDDWPRSPYMELERGDLVRTILYIRDRGPSVGELASGMAEKLRNLYLTTDLVQAALNLYAEHLRTQGTPPPGESGN